MNVKPDGTAVLETAPDSRLGVHSGEANAVEKTLETLTKVTAQR